MKMNEVNIGDVVGYATGPIESVPSLVIGKLYKWVNIKQMWHGRERTLWIKSEYLGNKVYTKFKDLIDPMYAPMNELSKEDE